MDDTDVGWCANPAGTRLPEMDWSTIEGFAHRGGEPAAMINWWPHDAGPV